MCSSKIIDFWQVFVKKTFMDSLFYSKIQKIFLLVNILILMAYYLKKVFKMNYRKFFSKTLVKKRCSSFFLVFLQIFPMIHFQYCFYLICYQNMNIYQKNILGFWSKIRDPLKFFSQISVRNLWILVTTCILVKERIYEVFLNFRQFFLSW